jgi:hypothetical protein
MLSRNISIHYSEGRAKGIIVQSQHRQKVSNQNGLLCKEEGNSKRRPQFCTSPKYSSTCKEMCALAEEIT